MEVGAALVLAAAVVWSAVVCAAEVADEAGGSNMARSSLSRGL